MADSISSPEAEAWAAPEHETACPGQGSPSGTCVQHSQLPPQQCCTDTNMQECSKLGSLQGYLCLSSATKRRQAAHGVLHARDCVPHPPPKTTTKLSPEHLGRVGLNQLSTGWGKAKSKPQTAPPCWALLLQHLPWHRTAPSSGTHQTMLGVVLLFLLHPTQSCSVTAARRDSRSCLLRGQTHRRLLCEGSSRFHGLAVLNYKSVN